MLCFLRRDCRPWLSAVPQDPRVQRNPPLPQRSLFLLPAYLGKVEESIVDSQLRKATGKERDYTVGF